VVSVQIGTAQKRFPTHYTLLLFITLLTTLTLLTIISNFDVCSLFGIVVIG